MSITVTPLAATKINEIVSENDELKGQHLRAKVVGGGCSGFTYDLYFDDVITEYDEEFESNDIKLYVDPLSAQYLDGTTIDWIDGLHGSGFKFDNPNVKGTCGCGSSFSA